MISCFETHDFRIDLAHALLIRGKKPKMSKTNSPEALRKRFSWVLSILKSFAMLNPVLTPRLLSMLQAASSSTKEPVSHCWHGVSSRYEHWEYCIMLVHYRLSRMDIQIFSMSKGEAIYFSASCHIIFPSSVFSLSSTA